MTMPETLTPVKHKGMSQNAVRHGLYAQHGKALRLRTKRVKSLVQRAKVVLTWIQPSDMATLRSWAELEIMSASMFTILEAEGVVSRDDEGQGIPKRLLGEYIRLKSLQLTYATALGMTPASRAALRVDALRGDDLASELLAERAKGTRGGKA